jgi:microcystin degradation protein MlrC
MVLRCTAVSSVDDDAISVEWMKQSPVKSLRIAVAGFSHETNTFAGWPTDLVDFEANGYFRGDELRSQAGTNTVVGGAIDAIDADPSLELIPLTATSAIPGGIVTARAVNEIEGEIVAGLRRSRPDAVVLDLHGAMVTELSDDGESETLARVRDVVGADTPVVAVLDLHANVSQRMVDLASALIPYHTYPHVDNAERGREAVAIATQTARAEIAPVSELVKLPLLPPGPKQFSKVEPTRSIMARAFELKKTPGVINVGVTFSFPYADCPFPGMGVILTTDGDRGLAERIGGELADFIWERREGFWPDVMTVEQAVHAAMAGPDGPIVLADLGDNPGGGSAGDGTALLWGLLDLGAPDAAFATLADPEVVAVAFEAGQGATIQVELGGKADELHGFPIPITAVVRTLSSGEFVYEGPMNAGVADTLGRTAVLTCDGRYGNKVEVVVCERRVQALDAAIFRSQGIEPAEKKIVAVKSAVHFRGSFGPIAKLVIEVDTPGLTSVDFSRFPYRRLPRPIWPLDAI